ncbi:hypothetical protein RJ55_07342 [Drechmeria coniospora]|nr:hypothetical protein RJ55_07342 [Drechmeria coniospora]
MAVAKESQQRLLPQNPSDSDDDLEFSQIPIPQDRRKRRPWLPLLVRAVLFLAVAVVLCAASFFAGARAAIRPSALDAKCAAHTTQWSPLLKDVPIRYEAQLFNGSFMKENIYRQVGSPEVDKAWDDLGVNYRPGVISYEDGLASGLQPSFVQRAHKYGGGFLVNVEGMHHLHCLNLLRKSLYFNFDRYKEMGQHAFKNDDKILRLHVTHCLDTIRQVLMCNADTGVLGQVWAGEKPAAFPDFNTKHRCKNYDDIRVWAEKLQVSPCSPASLLTMTWLCVILD